MTTLTAITHIMPNAGCFELILMGASGDQLWSAISV